MSLAVAGTAPVGESVDDRTRIERGVLTRLTSLAQWAEDGYLAALDAYNGEISDTAGLDDILAKLNGRSPGVLVLVGTVNYRPKSLRKQRYEAEYRVEVLCVSNHWRSREARNQGDEASKTRAKTDPGIYQILYDVRQRLIGRELGVCGASRPVPILEQPVIQADEFTAWNAVYEVRLRVEQSDHDDTPLEVTTLEHGHNLEDSDAVNPVAEGEVSNDA